MWCKVSRVLFLTLESDIKIRSGKFYFNFHASSKMTENEKKYNEHRYQSFFKKCEGQYVWIFPKAAFMVLKRLIEFHKILLIH